MKGLEREDLEDQEVERALQQVGRLTQRDTPRLPRVALLPSVIKGNIRDVHPARLKTRPTTYRSLIVTGPFTVDSLTTTASEPRRMLRVRSSQSRLALRHASARQLQGE